MPKGKERPDIAQYSLNEIAAGVQLQRNLLGRSESRSQTYKDEFITVTVTIQRTREDGTRK